MKNHPEHGINIDGELVAELLDQDEYASNLGNVAAVSNRQLCFLRRDWHKLSHYKLEYFGMDDCRAIEYQKEVVYYRILVGIAFFIAAPILMFTFATSLENISVEDAPLVIAVIAAVSFGVRFITSTHRHVICFEMPNEILTWRSPAIDFKYKAEAAHAVREYARRRGIFREAEE